ncbi:YtzI protein [Psychrobacillus sp. OK032]|uniref:YtzI protein n=1 Tax=Psychrobacillus sp. OK032 TaxID=1884358 RepID=UPI0008AAF21D|nr:YtzI protein [Psychrobacillus sp. OK032]SES07925.1 Tumour necrosis factor receptor superfamily member 19 [Psychrobacillus sp. OK032]
MTTVFIIGAITFIVVLVLSIYTINKGYAYKHTIDERPTEQYESKEKTHSP